MRARATGTGEAAEAAVRLDPKHVPAQVAPAAAHEREPDREGGLVEPVPGMLLVREARLLEGDAWLRLGQVDKALPALYKAAFWGSDEARQRLRSPTIELVRAMEARLKKHGDPDYLRCQMLEDLGAYRLRSGDVKGGVELLVKALFLPDYPGGSEILRAGGLEVRKELERLLTRRLFSVDQRERIQEVLKSPQP